MNNKGFTLIELLIVIAMIGLLATIFVPNVSNLIKRHKADEYESAIKSAETAAKNYIADNRYDQTNSESVYSKIKIGCPIGSANTVDINLTLNDLESKGYLSSEIKNPCNNAAYSIDKDNDGVRATYNCKTKTYQYKFCKNVKNTCNSINFDKNNC